MLFNKRLLQTHLNNYDLPNNLDANRIYKILSNWQESIKNGNYDKTKETQVQSAFLSKFFGIILGYTEMHDSPNEWYLVNEAKTEFDGTKADGALGYFSKDKNIVRAVIELKDANTSLDKKQSKRKDYDSPVSQAFSYSSKFDRCDWIIVSNFKEIRLYHKDRGQAYYETFEILKLSEDIEFKRFYFCLSKMNLLDENRNSLLDKLIKDTSKNEEDISNEFYKDFKNLRKYLFEHICKYNEKLDKKCLLEKTQKLLDRLVFVMFCEDSNIGLLSPYTLKNYYETGKNLPIPSDEKIWQIIKGLFTSIDKGNNDVNPPINKYNGGLFKYDEILDNLKIKDSAWQEVIKLSNYDFESDLNVNILGHIFEQSLSDLEQIKSEIDGIEQDKKKSKRKKDGIFYTPEYITRYIVEQTIGIYLEENPDKLESIKILDPACGSGAFLNQAHSFLQKQYKIRTEEKINNAKISKRGGQEFVNLNLFQHSNIAETDRSILLNNIYGVDLNSESTEITKLALWLKTAKKDQPLQNLDQNIKCGNSLIDDKTIAGDKAFNWNEEFKEIMADGGFDIIIGNPPYGATLDEKSKDFIYKYYHSIEYQIDTYVAFIEKSIGLLKQNGKLGFIVPSTWLNMHYFSKIRNLIINKTNLEKVFLFRYQVFEDVTAETCILVCSKKINYNNNILVSHLDKMNQFDNIIFNSVNQNYWKENVEKGFNVFYSQEKIDIVNKIVKNTKPLKDIANIIVGIKPYQTNKGIPKQTKADVEMRIYDSSFKKNEYYFKYIVGADISKYYISEQINTYIKYGGWLAEPRKSLNFAISKIVIRQTSDKIISAVDNLGYYNLNNVHNILLKENVSCNLNYLTTLLNSRLMDFVYKFLVPESGRVFAEVKGVNLAKLPIPNATIEQQENLAKKAEQMIELNKKLHNSIDSALELINSEYQPKKISKNLKNFYTLGIHPFIEELEKQKVKLTLSQKEELISWYKEKSENLINLQKQINSLDKSIDTDVYNLYCLTNEEIDIIEQTIL